MEFHEAAAVFPMLDSEEYDAFRQDIKEHGLKEPIVTYKGKIIDGRNRFRACRELNIKPVYTEWDGEGSLTEYVVSLNLHRRHLTINQRAMLGAKIRERLQEEARERMERTQFSTTPTAGQNSDEPHAADSGRASEHAASIVKTSRFPVEKASIVLDKGCLELHAAVQAEQVAIHNAADLATLPHDEQRAIVAEGPEKMLERAKEIRQQKRDSAPAPAQPERECIAARGMRAVGKYLDLRIDGWAKADAPHAQAVFDELRAVRKDLCGR